MKGWEWNVFNFVPTYFEISQTYDGILPSENNKKGKMRRWEACAKSL